MKTKEFIRKVEGLGFYAEERGDEVYLYRYNSNCLAKISKKFQYTINTFYREFMDLNEENRSLLFDLTDEYISTPTNEREEPTKYYLKHKWIKTEGYNYLNFEIKDNNYICASQNKSNIYQTQFTKEEIEEIKRKLNTDLSDFEIVEVGEWEKIILQENKS